MEKEKETGGEGRGGDSPFFVFFWFEVDGSACCLLNAPTYLFIETIAVILKVMTADGLTGVF